MSIKQFEGMSPVFLPERFFHGRLEGWAVLESLIGGLLKRATITAEGQWDEAKQVVQFVETYRFDDGHEDTLNWAIKKLGPGKYNGSEPHLEGEAEGDQAGCAFHWRYTRETPQSDGKTTKLNFDDWFYLIDDNACIVRGTAGRAGLPFATAHVTYRRLAGP
ncbi:conserved hypothetical protein [Bradyrhizobium sp. ORS 375]|uniref:DUF3833 family protein n=1 Tax=Bradyrhizobium sp. (strain ORS 375) TaxID=566679 RepID=UPI0002406A47|nr:DUF3833 family protein [Bradyrhizobium sp. ORS 375]CCD95922.1 conserved hypothetical protein [Bradyrhizobium sp. ORS 375]